MAARTPALSTDRAFSRLYDALSRSARGALRGGTALDARELVHDTYLRLSPHGPWESTGHFYTVATRAMGQLVRNRFRDQNRLRRGNGAPHVTLSDDAHGRVTRSWTAALDLQDAINALSALSPRVACVVACRAVSGLSVEETAEEIGVGTATVKRDWAVAKVFLTRYLSEHHASTLPYPQPCSDVRTDGPARSGSPA